MMLAQPAMLWLLLVLLVPLAWYVWKQKRLDASLAVSTLSPFKGMRQSRLAVLRHVVFAMQMLTAAVLIVILARPQRHDAWSSSATEGTDIILAMDISTSMLAKDFRPDRLSAAKSLATKFVSGRDGDNMGLVIFAGESFTAVPMTNDRALLSNYLADLRIGMINDGTAIGDGLATGVSRIRQGKAKSKSIILLTDGTNNTGTVSPVTAAEIAAKNGVKVYTIGVGTNGEAEMPVSRDFAGRLVYERVPVSIDEPTLQRIADMTGGKYFRATDEKVLGRVFDEIDQLEKTRMDVQRFTATEDHYTPWAIAALALFVGAMLLKMFVIRPIP